MNAASPLVVVNPRARLARHAWWEPLRHALIDAWSARIVHTRDAAHATTLVRDAVEQGCPLIGVVGGDGTVNVALNALDGRDVPLAVIPLGTANDLARELPAAQLGSPATTNSAWKRIDVLQVNGRRFCTTGGLGIASHVLQRVEALRATRARGVVGLLGHSIYSLVAAEHALRARTRPERWHVSWLPPGAQRREQREVHGLGLFVSNQASLGGALLVCPGARNDDGVFEICLLPACSPGELLALLASMRAGRTSARLEILRATEATIVAEHPGSFFGDGEQLCLDGRFEISIQAGAARAARPHAPGASATRVRAKAPW